MGDRDDTDESPGEIEATEFARGLRLGLGRAIVALRAAGGGARFRELVLHACRRNLVYDRQCEAWREQYLFDLIAATGEPEFYRRWLSRATAPSRLGGAGGGQLLSLLRLFATAGDGEARARLYEIFAVNAATERPDGAAEIVKLDGLAGLLAIAPCLDVDEEDPWFARYLIEEASERDGETATWAALDTLAGREPAVGRLLALVRVAEERGRERRAHADDERSTPPDYSTIRARLLAGESGAGSDLARWALSASEAELTTAATDLLATDAVRPRNAYLRVFSRHRFPLDPAPLLALARDPSPRIAAPTFKVLSLIESDDVRVLALEFLSTGRGDGARLLGVNRRVGDFALIERLMLTWDDRDELHALGFGLRDLAEAHPIEAARGALLAHYERGPCSLCRDHAVDLLAKLGPLPGWLVAECRWDANPTIRELVG